MEEQQNDVQNIMSNQEDELDSLNSNKNQKKSGKKKTIAITGILLLVGAIGISFAYWLSTATQESINKITSGCLQVTIKDINNSAIDLAEAYPISDSEAAELTPYTFEIENICKASAEYNINLEVLKSLKEDTDQLSSNYVAVSFDGGSKRVLTNYTSVEPTYSDDEYRAVESYNLYSNGTLAGHEKKQYTIKLWIDETAEGKDIMNQTFLSKISVTSGVSKPSPTPNTLASQVEIGDYISMRPTSTSYTIPASETGCTNSSYCGGITDQTINPSELNLWRVINKNDDGTVEAVSEYVSSTDVYFYGQTGYLNLVGALNKITKQYENSIYTVGSRHMGYNGQTEYITDESKFTNPAPWTTSTSDNSNEVQGGGDILYQKDETLVKASCGDTLEANKVGTTTATGYWLASRIYEYSPNGAFGYNWTGRSVSISGSVYSGKILYNYNSGWHESANCDPVRPIVTLKSDLTVSGGGKSESDPYILK